MYIPSYTLYKYNTLYDSKIKWTVSLTEKKQSNSQNT